MKKQKQNSRSKGQEDHSRLALKGIRRMLYYKDLVPGQKISCCEIADKMDMSLTPVIQALKFMEFQGFTRHEPNRGYFMTPQSLQELEEIYELRLLIEPSLIPYTMGHLDREATTRLKTALEDHLSATKEIYSQERYFKNVGFHLTVASLSNKTTHIRFLRNSFDLLLLKYGGTTDSTESMNIMDDEHKKIFDHIVSGDLIVTQRILTDHIVSVKNQVLERFRKILERKELPEL